MNKIRTIVIGILFLFTLESMAHDGKTTKVMEEMIQLHDWLVKESPNKFNVSKLKTLLEKGGDSKKDTEAFKKAIPLVEKLALADSKKAKLEVYSELVETLSSTVGNHDKSGANVFYCPMVKKKWISKGEIIVNPYDKDMRNCGEKI